MKKTLIALALIAATATAAAQHRQDFRHYNHNRGHGYYGGAWVVPALIGGAIIYGVTRDQSPPVQYVPVPVSPQPPQCPTGTEANYSRIYVQDTTGRFTETYKFNGCVVTQ